MIKVEIFIEGIKEIPYLTGINITPNSIHFYCEEGREEKLFNALPLWVTNYGEVHRGKGQVFTLKARTS